MSTRAYIAVEHNDGSVSAVYSHSDGMPENMLNLLPEHYGDIDKALELVNGGGISELKPTLEETSFYIRDWNRDPQENSLEVFDNVTDLLRQLVNTGIEFAYIFENHPQRHWRFIPLQTRPLDDMHV